VKEGQDQHKYERRTEHRETKLLRVSAQAQEAKERDQKNNEGMGTVQQSLKCSTKASAGLGFLIGRSATSTCSQLLLLVGRAGSEQGHPSALLTSSQGAIALTWGAGSVQRWQFRLVAVSPLPGLKGPCLCYVAGPVCSSFHCNCS